MPPGGTRDEHGNRAYLAVAWAIIFAAPHVYWATGATAGLGTRYRSF